MRKLFTNTWWVVVGSVMGLIVGNGPIMQFTFGVFVKPVGEALHADRGAMSAALMTGLFMTGLTTLLAGRLVDRFGIRAVSLPAITLFALGMAAIGLLADSTLALCILYGLSGIAAAGQTPLPYSKAIAANFDQKRGLALGIAMAGVGLGTALMPIFAQHLLATFGWRMAYVGLGAITFVVAMPAMAFLVTGQKQTGNSPSAACAGPLAAGLTAHESLQNANFWKLAVAFFLVAVAASGVIAHVVPMMVDLGVPPAKAAGAMSAAGLALIGGRLIAGWMLDRVHAPNVAIAFFLLPLAGIVMLITTTTASLAIPAAILVGLGLGAEVDLIAYLQSRYLGLRAFGQIYGYLFAVFMAGSALGPFLMGSSFQQLRSYQPALILLAGGLVVSCALMAFMGAYAYRPGSAQDNKHP